MIEDGAYIVYRIINTENNFMWFPLEFEFIENANIACDFYSKRDSKQYVVKKYYMEIGRPEYHDHLIEEFAVSG